VAEFRKRLCESSISWRAASFAIWLSKMILATRSNPKTFSLVGKQAGASIPTRSTENGGAKFRKKEWQRIGNWIETAFIFARSYFINMNGKCKAFGSVYGALLIDQSSNSLNCGRISSGDVGSATCSTGD
jgi:hypothetical protein